MKSEYMEHIGWRAARRRAKKRRRHADALSDLADAKAADDQAKNDVLDGSSDDDQSAVDDISPETAYADDWCRENVDNYDGRTPHEAMLAYCQAHGECLEYPTVNHFNNYLRKQNEYAEGSNVISPFTDAANDTADIIGRFIGTLEANKASFDYAEYCQEENWFFGLIPNKKKMEQAKQNAAAASQGSEAGDAEKGKGMMKWILIALGAVLAVKLIF